jgi:quercetin dioxygenase-like cupin family protein
MQMLRHWDELAAEARGPTVSKQALDGQGASLVRIDIKAGTKAARHSHSFEQFVQVLSGRGTLETEEGIHPFSAGSLFHFLAEAWHAAEFDEDTILVETNLKP